MQTVEHYLERAQETEDTLKVYFDTFLHPFHDEGRNQATPHTIMLTVSINKYYFHLSSQF